MNQHQQKVLAFHKAVGATVGRRPEVRDARLRVDLIREEYLEFADAVGWMRFQPQPASLIGAIDAICDLLYVTYGAAVAFGIDIEPFFAEVHRSNMTKIGGPVREDGKVLKPVTYEPPNLEPILRQQELAARLGRRWWGTSFAPVANFEELGELIEDDAIAQGLLG